MFRLFQEVSAYLRSLYSAFHAIGSLAGVSTYTPGVEVPTAALVEYINQRAVGVPVLAVDTLIQALDPKGSGAFTYGSWQDVIMTSDLLQAVRISMQRHCCLRLVYLRCNNYISMLCAGERITSLISAAESARC